MGRWKISKKWMEKHKDEPDILYSSAPQYLLMLLEAKASLELDSIEGIHTCHDECPCHERRKLAQTLGNIKGKEHGG